MSEKMEKIEKIIRAHPFIKNSLDPLAEDLRPICKEWADYIVKIVQMILGEPIPEKEQPEFQKGDFIRLKDSYYDEPGGSRNQRSRKGEGAIIIKRDPHYSNCWILKFGDGEQVSFCKDWLELVYRPAKDC